MVAFKEREREGESDKNIAAPVVSKFSLSVRKIKFNTGGGGGGGAGGVNFCSHKDSNSHFSFIY
jgi:nanoRNase/pAp phosphatase (c-di-AMP/oligoRNAs hydrolase)